MLRVGRRSDLVSLVFRVVTGQCSNDISISFLRLDEIARGDDSSSDDRTLSQLRLFILVQLVVFSCRRLSESVVVTSILNGVGGGIIPVSSGSVSDLHLRSGVPICLISILSGDSKTFCGNVCLLTLVDFIESVETCAGNSIAAPDMLELFLVVEPAGNKQRETGAKKIAVRDSSVYDSE